MTPTAWTLVIVLIVLGSLVIMLALLWAYIHYVKIRPRKRTREGDEAIGYYYRGDEGLSLGKQDWGEQGDSRSQTFLIWHYSKRMRGGDRQDCVT